MRSSGSITRWLGQLKAGAADAVEPLWERYFRRLVGLARARLQGTPRRAADEEDVALSAFDSFCRGAEDGRFPQLADRDNLWRLLVTLTARKAYQLAQHEGRQKRGGHRVPGEGAPPGPAEEGDVARFLDPHPTPQFAAQVAEEYQRLLASLPGADLRSVAQWKMEGFTNDEIAAKLGCALRSVERKLKVIRSLWGHEGDTL